MLRRKGFTLIELLVVVAIISLLAAIAVPRLVDRIRKARMTRAEADIASIETALAMLVTDAGAPLLMLLDEYAVVPLVLQLTGADNLYRLYAPPPWGAGWSAMPLVNGIFKSTIEYEPGGVWAGNLKARVHENLAASYMEKGIPKDPWGNPYQILLAPSGRYIRRDWAHGINAYAGVWPGFWSYRGELAPRELAPPGLDQYIYSIGENRMDDTLATGFIAYDDINNYDADRGWSIVYR